LWSHYTGLRDDLATARSDFSAMTTRAESAEQLANRNAAAALKADIDRRAAISALETAQAAFRENSIRSRDAETAIRSAPDSDDGPVAPILEGLRSRRFQ
jgi:phage I-like protein